MAMAMAMALRMLMLMLMLRAGTRVKAMAHHRLSPLSRHSQHLHYPRQISGQNRFSSRPCRMTRLLTRLTGRAGVRLALRFLTSPLMICLVGIGRILRMRNSRFSLLHCMAWNWDWHARCYAEYTVCDAMRCDA